VLTGTERILIAGNTNRLVAGLHSLPGELCPALATSIRNPLCSELVFVDRDEPLEESPTRQRHTLPPW
jgi:hypothetical protein